MGKRKFVLTDREVDEGNGPTKVTFIVPKDGIEQPKEDTAAYDVWAMLQDLITASSFAMGIEEVPAADEKDEALHEQLQEDAASDAAFEQQENEATRAAHLAEASDVRKAWSQGSEVHSD